MPILSIITEVFSYCKSFGSQDLRLGVQVAPLPHQEGGIFIICDRRTAYLKLTGGGADIARKTNYKTGRLILKKFAV